METFHPKKEAPRRFHREQKKCIKGVQMKNQKVPKRYNILNPYKVEKFLILFSKFNSFLKMDFSFF